MPECKLCETKGFFLTVSQDGLCETCERVVSKNLVERIPVMHECMEVIAESKDMETRLSHCDLLIEHAEVLMEYECKGIPTMEPLASELVTEYSAMHDQILSECATKQVEEEPAKTDISAAPPDMPNDANKEPPKTLKEEYQPRGGAKPFPSIWEVDQEISDKEFSLPDLLLKDYPDVEEEYSEPDVEEERSEPDVEEERPEKVSPEEEMDSWLQTLASSKKQGWSRRSLLLIGLLCVVLAALHLTVISFMKPKVKRPRLVSERTRLPITSIERKEEITIPPVVGIKGRKEKSSEEGILEHEKQTVAKPPEPWMMIPERGIDEKAVKIGALEEDEKTQAEEIRYKDTIFGEEIPEGDIKIKGKMPETISVPEGPSAGETHEKSVKEFSQSRPITAGAAELEREPGRIEVTETKASKPREMSVRQPSQISHTKHLKDTRAHKKYDAPSNIRDKSISVARLSTDSRSSIEREERIIQIQIASRIATEEEVKNFFAEYRERYARKDLEGLFSLFSSKAVENGRYGIEEMKKIYSDFFDKSEKLRYDIEDAKIEIYQNGVEVKGRYKIEQTAKKGRKENAWWGDIRWVLVRENGVLKISLLDYRHQKSP